MPYDPALPANGSPTSSAGMRGQLTGLKDLIDAKVASVTGGVVDSTDPANPIIRTDVIGGAAKLAEGDRIPAGATNRFLGADVSGSNGFANPNLFVAGDNNP